jgi:hypothetical protein
MGKAICATLTHADENHVERRSAMDEGGEMRTIARPPLLSLFFWDEINAEKTLYGQSRPLASM